jgi:osmotically-inducible protein OsmY
MEGGGVNATFRVHKLVKEISMRQRKIILANLGLLAALTVATGAAPALATDSSEFTKQRVAVAEEEHHPDAWITTKVKAKLLKDSFMSGLNIKVSTNDGVVQLAGFVKKPEQINLAEQIAINTEGVKRVQNDLQLEH